MKESGCVQQEIVSPDLLWGHSAPSLPHSPQPLLSPLEQRSQPLPPASPPFQIFTKAWCEVFFMLG